MNGISTRKTLKIAITILGLLILCVLLLVGVYVYKHYIKTYSVPLSVFPTNATVELNQKVVNVGEQNVINLPIGSYTVQVSADGYISRTISFDVADDAVQEKNTIALTPHSKKAYASYERNDARAALYEDDTQSNGLYARAPLDMSDTQDFVLSECPSVRYTINALCFQGPDTTTNMKKIQKILYEFHPRYPVELYEIYPISKHGMVVYKDQSMEVIFVKYAPNEVDKDKDGVLTAYTKRSKKEVMQRIKSANISDSRFDIILRDPSSNNEEFEING